MSDNRFNQYIVEDEIPNEVIQAEKPVLKKELAPPPAVNQSAIPPGILPPGITPQNLSASLNPIPTTPVAAPIDVNALKTQALKIKNDLGPVTAPDLISKDMATPLTFGAIGAGALAATAGLGYLLNKKSSIADRDIKKIEPELNVNKQPQPGATEPVLHEPQFSSLPTDAEKLAAENIKMQSTELPGHVFNKYGVAPTNVKDLMIFANQATPEMKANFAPDLINMLNKGVIPKPAADAGVTPSTSLPEAQTLVTTAEAAKDPIEKAQEKTIEGAAKPKATKAKNPVESMKNYLTGSQGFNEEQYNTLMKDILGKDLEMPSTGGGFGEKSHPEEWNKYMAWRKENIEGPKSNLNFDIKKKLRDVEKIEDPKARATARNALIVSLMSLPAFLNAKTSKEMREARQGLGEAILPIGMTPTEAGAPTLPPNAYSESKKLGSPFRKQLMGVAPPAR
jgi:hypothetical protein